MFSPLKKYPPIFISALLLIESSWSSEENMLISMTAETMQQEVMIPESAPFMLSDWFSIVKWNDFLTHNEPVIVEDFGTDKEEIYWALGMVDRIFDIDYSPVIQQTFVDALITYSSKYGYDDSLEESAFALGNLEGDLRTYFKNEIRKSGWFCTVQERARLTLYHYMIACNTDDFFKADRREKLRSLFQEAFSGSYHSIWGFKGLEKSFKKAPYYPGLHIHDRDYSSEQLIEIGQYAKKYNIRDLMMAENVFDLASMSHLAEGLRGITSLTSLYFYEVQINKKGGFYDFVNALDNLPGLAEINMRKCGIDDSNHDSLMHLISEAKNLKELELSFNPLSERTQLSLFDALKANQFAGRISLSGLKFTLDSISALAGILAQNTPITHLDIGYTSSLSNDFLEMILRSLWMNKYVINVNISNNLLDQSSGSAALGRLLRENKTLQSLDMGSLKIQPDQMVEIAQGLEQNISLTNLRLSEDNYGSTGVKALAQALSIHPTLKHMSMRDNKLSDQITALLLTFLQFNTSLEKFELHRSTFGMEAAHQFQASFPHNRTIKELEFSYVEMTDAVLDVLTLGIRPDTSLEKIALGGDNLRNTLPLARTVWRAPQIKSIRIYNNGSMDKKSSYAFAYMVATRKLDCYIEGYNQDIIHQLAVEKKERVLKYLEASQFYAEKGLLNLNYLKLQDQDSKVYFQTDGGLYQSIDKLHLRKVTFDEESLSHLIAFLKSKPHMTEFGLQRSGLEAHDLYQVLKGLRNNMDLKCLKVRGEKMSDKVALFLQKFLQKTMTLEELDVSKIDGKIRHSSMIALGLEGNKTLNILHLRNHSLSSLMRWMRALWLHPTLQKVNIDYFWNVSIDEEISELEFKETLKNGSNKNKKIVNKVTAITLFYIKKHKKIDIKFRYDMDEKILPYTDQFELSIREFLDRK